MADQREEEVRKGAHGAWQIHYQIVVPVKYRKALRDEAVTTIIQDNGGGDCGPVSDRDGRDWDGQASHPSARQCASENGAATDCADIQEPHRSGNLSTEACSETGTVGRGIWDRRVLCGNGGGASERADG